MLEQISKERALVKKVREKLMHTSKPSVSIITPTVKQKYIDNIFTNYLISNYPIKELIIILNNNNLNIYEYKMKATGLTDVRIFQLDESYSLGECLNYGVEQSKYSYISKMDDDDYYGPNYLVDLMNVFKYTDAEVTGKTSRFVYFTEKDFLGIFTPNYENSFVEIVGGGTILFKKQVFEKVKFKNLNVGEDNNFLSDCVNNGIKIFSGDKYNYVYMRNKALQDHTWQISDKELIDNYIVSLPITIDFRKIVTV